MSRIELANKLNDLMFSINTYEYYDCEYNTDKALNDIINNPYVIINELIDIIEMLTE